MVSGVSAAWTCLYSTLVCSGAPGSEAGGSGAGSAMRAWISREVGLRATRFASADRKSSMRTQP